jgi:hypothetical protein
VGEVGKEHMYGNAAEKWDRENRETEDNVVAKEEGKVAPGNWANIHRPPDRWVWYECSEMSSRATVV